ncbi:MAG: hypothetical protein ACLP4R_16335 [Solirubrobacteraceae bacterium]
MERNAETLSTRDLASPNEPAGGVTTSEADVQDTTAAEGQPEVYDHDQATPVTEGAPPPVDERTTAPPGEARTEAPAADQSVEEAPRSTGAAASTSNGGGSLLPADMDATFQQRWKEIQTRFVDEPRGAVEEADGLVANLMQQLAEGFAKERERLEAQWGRGEDISTEDLRVALQRYRTFFQRLLST